VDAHRIQSRGVIRQPTDNSALVSYLVSTCWFGLLEVVEGPFIDNTPIFVPENDPDVVRFRVQTGVWLDITPRFTPMKRSTMVCGRLAPIHAGRFRI